MNCESVEDLLSAYMDDELSTNDCHSLEEHLKTCSHCQNVLYELQETSRMVKVAWAEEQPRADFEQRIIQTVQASQQRTQVRRLSILYLLSALFGVITLTSVLVSPLGIFLRALTRLAIVIARGLISMSTSVGLLALAGIVISCIALAGLSIVGISRMLRPAQSEVVV